MKSYKVGNHTISFNSNQDMVARALSKGQWETFSILHWINVLEEMNSPTVLDIGAYTGVYSLFAYSCGANIHSYEPIKNIFSRLQENCAGTNIQLHNYALGNEKKNSTINVVNDTPLPSGSSIYVRSTKRPMKKESIKMTTIDHEHSCADVIKIDVEGYEFNVLSGGIQLLKRCKPIIFIELLTEEAFSSVYIMLKDIGYTTVEYMNDKTFNKSSVEAFAAPGNYVIT